MGIVSLNCPNCGAQVEMDDSREFGYCSICGSKVMVDRMIVEHKGSVKIDQSDKVKNALIVARRARDNNDIENAKRNYDIVLAEEPNNWEAYFYSTVFSNHYVKNGELGIAIDKVNRCFYSTETMIDSELIDSEENFNAKDSIARAAVFNLTDLLVAAQNYAVRTPAPGTAIDFGTSAFNNAERIIKHLDLLSERDQRYRKTATELYKLLLSVSVIKSSVPVYWPITDKERCQAIANRIREDEPDYKSIVENKSGGCYVATCVYDSYDCPQVWTLRRYRDDTLAATWYGRAFIRTYYAVSPTLVKWFGKTKWFKKMWQGKLDRMVRRLNASGVADTPYNDKQW